MRLNGFKRKINLGQIKQYVKRKRELSECNRDDRDGRDEQAV